MNKNDMKEKSETCWTENYYAPMQPAIAFWVIISLSIIWGLEQVGYLLPEASS